MTRSPRTGAWLLAAAVAMLSNDVAALPQIELGVMRGIVRDEAGEPLEGVSFKIHDIQRGRDIVLTSGKDGRFYRRGLPAVEYEITVEKAGYQPIHDTLKLTAGMDRNFDFKLVKAAPEGAEEFAAGVAAFNRGDAAAAAEAFEASMAKAPDLPEVRVNLALAYLRLNRTADAIAQLEKAAELAPNDPHVLFQLGGAYVETNTLDRAKDVLERGLAQAPDLSDPFAYDATVTLGAVLFATGDNDGAIREFERALTEKPGAAAPQLGLGKAYFSKGDTAKALELFQQVIAAAPGTPEAEQAQAFVAELERVDR